jgi:purine-binding chemotaxis protein CheW
MVEGMVLFQVAGATYAVRSAQVVMVEMVESITRVPRAAAFVEGVTAIRGQVIPVVSIRKRFHLEEAAPDLRTRLVVIRVHGRTIGMMVDSAREYIKIDHEQILPPPEALSGPGIEYLEGVVNLHNRLVLLVNLEQLFSREEQDRLVELAEENSSGS